MCWARLGPITLKYMVTPKLILTRLTNLRPVLSWGVSGLETEPNGEHENADAMNFGEEMTGQLSMTVM